jgi:hypothetical protein
MEQNKKSLFHDDITIMQWNEILSEGAFLYLKQPAFSKGVFKLTMKV